MQWQYSRKTTGRPVRMLFGQYDRYIRLKLAEDDGGLAEQMTGYPAKEDEIFADSFREQMDAWFGNGKNRENCEGTEQAETWKYAVMEPALALELDHPSVYTQFLKQSIDEFLTDYQERYPVFQDWFRERKVERIYIGNAFCHLLFPEETTLFSMLDKAYKLGLKITVTFSYVREYQLKHMEKLLKKLEQWCREENTKLEIEVNDWAMADMLKYSLPDLIPCYGRMLNKQEKRSAHAI